LLNEIDEATARKLCLDPAWGAMEKKDGERRPLLIENGKAEGTNRYGIYTGGMKTSIAKAIDASINLIIDTEDMGTKLEAFDMIEIDGKNLRNMGFGKRHQALCDSPTIANSKSISIVPLFVTSEDKLALLERMIAENREGLVFKKLNAPYTPDRPASMGDQLKFKLYDECSVMVTKINVQRSFQMGVFDKDGNQVIVGNCTIPANAKIPTVGDVIEVKYLYAYKGGSLYQPSLNKPRPDQRTEECRQSQLKYKPDAAA
jgi:bifunctional non-homologous end joining protein LigD